MPVMETIDEGRLESDLGYRVWYLREFMGFDDGDVAAMVAVREQVAPRVDAVVDAVYEKFFGYNCTKRHFLPRQHGYEGPLPTSLDDLTMDHELIQFRKAELRRYLMRLITGPYDKRLIGALDRVGAIHTPEFGSAELDVPLVQMNAMLGFIADRVTAMLLELDLEPEPKGQVLRAFGKLLWLQNDLVTRRYAR
jgi:hypothetical protein